MPVSCGLNVGSNAVVSLDSFVNLCMKFGYVHNIWLYFFLFNMIYKHRRIMFITLFLTLQGRVSGGNCVGAMSRMTSFCSGLNVGTDLTVSQDSFSFRY